MRSVLAGQLAGGEASVSRVDAVQHLAGRGRARTAACSSDGVDVAQRGLRRLRDLRRRAAGRLEVGDGAVEHVEDVERRRRRHDLEAVAVGRRAADAHGHAVDLDRLARDVGRVGRCAVGSAVLQDRIGGDAAARRLNCERVVGAGERARVASRGRCRSSRAVDAGAARSRTRRCRVRAASHAASPSVVSGSVVVGSVTVCRRWRRRTARRRGASTNGLLRRALAAEQIAAGAVARGWRRRAAASRSGCSSLGELPALGVAVAGVAGGDDRLARLLQQLAGIAERAFGLRHRVAARVDGALARLAAPTLGHRALGARRRGRIVAGARRRACRWSSCSCAWRSSAWRRCRVSTPASKALAVLIRMAMLRSGARKAFVFSATSAAACRTPTARPAASWPRPGSSAGTGSAAPPPRRG